MYVTEVERMDVFGSVRSVWVMCSYLLRRLFENPSWKSSLFGQATRIVSEPIVVWYSPWHFSAEHLQWLLPYLYSTLFVQTERPIGAVSTGATRRNRRQSTAMDQWNVRVRVAVTHSPYLLTLNSDNRSPVANKKTRWHAAPGLSSPETIN